eukprot:3288567-Pleurochrysis_carterae.AAC.2
MLRSTPAHSEATGHAVSGSGTYQRSVDVHFRHVIHDESHLHSMASARVRELSQMHARAAMCWREEGVKKHHARARAQRAHGKANDPERHREGRFDWQKESRGVASRGSDREDGLMGTTT